MSDERTPERDAAPAWYAEGWALADGLVGAWRLRSWVAEAADGSVERPFGEAPVGMIVFTASGVAVTAIGGTGRLPLSGGDLLSGPTDERLAAMGSFLAYSGTWRVEANEVVISIVTSLYPNWDGTEQRRLARLSPDGASLELSTGPIPVGGRLARHTLTWERQG